MYCPEYFKEMADNLANHPVYSPHLLPYFFSVALQTSTLAIPLWHFLDIIIASNLNRIVRFSMLDDNNAFRDKYSTSKISRFHIFRLFHIIFIYIFLFFFLAFFSSIPTYLFFFYLYFPYLQFVFETISVSDHYLHYHGFHSLIIQFISSHSIHI